MILRVRHPDHSNRTILIAAFAVILLASSGLRMAAARQNGSAYPIASEQSQNNSGYIGDQACRTCHSSIYETFKRTGMGRSTSIPSAEDLRELEKPVTIVSKKLNRSYKVYAQDGKIIHEESGIDAAGHRIFAESHEIAYTIGAGDVGKSYLVSKGDYLFVSPISYYTRIHNWDLSPGYRDGIFRGFTRRVVDLCVDCHTGWPLPVPGTHDRFQQPPFRSLTIGCERCHGPGATHVAQRSGGGSADSFIVNPRELAPELRDDVCAQCHLAGDARVLQPGKNYLDFRPGTPLGDVVAIFSVPQSIKGNHFIALDQFEEMKLSKCWMASKGRLGCISCHDPHLQLQGNDAVDFFRSRCLTCHTSNGCTAPALKRRATAPADNCISCHMPQHPSEDIGHSSLTDHRILRSQSEIPPGLQAAKASPLDLISDTKPSSSSEPQNLRNLALAYAQVGARYPELAAKGLAILEKAAATLPSDEEVLAAYGNVLVSADPTEGKRAAQILQRAIDAGSKSAEVRVRLGRLRLQEGGVTAAIELFKQSIQMDPYFTPAYLDLAQVYSMLKDRRNALESLDSVLKIDPGNDAARQERLKAAALPVE